MPQSTSWYYRQTTSPNYPSVTGKTSSSNKFDDEVTPKKRSASAKPRALGSTGQSPERFSDFLERVSRPTMSSRYRYDCPRMSNSYTGRVLTWNDHYIWSKMNNSAETRGSVCGLERAV